MKENKEEMKKSSGSHTFFTIILALGLVCICTGVGFLIGTKMNGKENTGNKTEEKEVKNLVTELTEADVQEYESIIKLFNEYFSTKYPLKVENLTNQEVLYSAMLEVLPKDEYGYRNYSTTFAENDLGNMITKIYGADFKYTNEDILCRVNDGVLFQYNDNQYSFNGVHGHDGCFTIVSNNFIDAKSANDTIEIRFKNIYGGTVCGTYGPIETFYKDALSKEPIYTQTTDDYEKRIGFDEVYELKKDEIPITTFVFQKDSVGNYGLKEIAVTGK